MSISPISSALNGLQTNLARLDKAAQQVTVISDAGGDTVDIAGAFVGMMTAELGVEASIKAIKSENEMQKQIIDILV